MAMRYGARSLSKRQRRAGFIVRNNAGKHLLATHFVGDWGYSNRCYRTVLAQGTFDLDGCDIFS